MHIHVCEHLNVSLLFPNWVFPQYFVFAANKKPASTSNKKVMSLSIWKLSLAPSGSAQLPCDSQRAGTPGGVGRRESGFHQALGSTNPQLEKDLLAVWCEKELVTKCHE